MSEKTSGKQEYVKPSGNPTTFRIVAVILWILGLGFEVGAIGVILQWFVLPSNPIIWIIGMLVADMILVVIGSTLWKRANKIDPPSEKNKIEFFLKTQLGAIIAVIAFAPVLIILLMNKDMDKQTKTWVSIAAAICLMVAVGFSIDYTPVSLEMLEQMRVNAANSDFGDGEVKWSKNSQVYHTWEDCSALGRVKDDNLRAGTVDEAFEQSKARMCRFCANNFGITEGVEGGDSVDVDDVGLDEGDIADPEVDDTEQ